MKKKKKLIIGLIILVLLVAVIIGVFLYAKKFLSAETAIRDDWSIETGDLLASDASLNVSVFESDVEASIPVARVLPDENEEEGFTYYDENVQQRLASAIVKIARDGKYTLASPLAILNPFGTGSNGLYLYFNTQRAGNIRYTIHVEKEGIPDYTAMAYEGEGTRTRHEFQMIGLVAGEENTVTMELLGKKGKVISQTSFTIRMPETMSGYSIVLDSENGESTQELSNGLYAMIRVGGHTGYAFFYDNDGILRYEMVLEGYGLDRILWYEGNMTVCVSAYKIAQVNRLGQAVAVYDMQGYELHHDMVLEGEEGKIIALASDTSDEVNLEDMTVEVDLETGEVKEILDFKEIFSDYYQNDASELTATDEFFWLAGKKDWIHLNTIQYLPEDDSVIVSSRETSTIIKVENVHSGPQIGYLIGDEDFWKGTPYEEYSYTQIGDFVPQYGQHTVEYYEGEGLEEDQYYLMMFDNNYWVNGTRDDYEIEDLPDSVGTVLASDSLKSHVYVYLVDEGEKTFGLVHSFDVPYSSIVSNVTPCGDNLVVNSGTANVFGEYDMDGGLIRQFSYECELQTYRVMKDDFEGFWFAEG
ncbi:MAG TPA: aryl-sulfate sulfotransferase [Candidatus Eisenbergiella intestinipullorum]|nr:aryl-sulfate sulfotransferase [Candidatus Eisenbergiella intestinipullorum]